MKNYIMDSKCLVALSSGDTTTDIYEWYDEARIITTNRYLFNSISEINAYTLINNKTTGRQKAVQIRNLKKTFAAARDPDQIGNEFLVLNQDNAEDIAEIQSEHHRPLELNVLVCLARQHNATLVLHTSNAEQLTEDDIDFIDLECE